VCREVAALAAEMGVKVGVVEIRSPKPEGLRSLAALPVPPTYEPDEQTGFTRWALPESFAALPRAPRAPRDWVKGLDMMLIDAPKAGSFMQQYLAPLSDGVVLVTDTRRRGWREVLRAAQNATDRGGTLVGAVMNRHKSPLPRWIDRWGDRP
jgi:hypothetical protein